MATWNSSYEDLPKNSQSPTQVDDSIRGFKGDVRARMENEHDTYNDGTSGTEALDFRHKEGSARAWYETGEPANAPGSGNLQAGHLWVDSDGGYHMEVYTGSAWTPVGLETLTSDPGSPFEGQIWLRTDV